MREVFRSGLPFALAVILTWPIAATAGPHDGDWQGHLIAPPVNRDTCGFSETPFTLTVEDNTFVGTAEDGSKTKRTFEGEIGSDNHIETWAPWLGFGFNLAPMVLRTKIEGDFSGDVFEGVLTWSDVGGDALCFARLNLFRGDAETAAPVQEAGPRTMDGEEIRSHFVGNSGSGTSISSSSQFDVRINESGTIHGMNPSNGSDDVGRWRIENNIFCHTWNQWTGGAERCFRLATDGKTVDWHIQPDDKLFWKMTLDRPIALAAREQPDPMARKPRMRPLKGWEIQTLYADNQGQGRTVRGNIDLTLRYAADGRLAGTVMGSGGDDIGRWSVEDDLYCSQWNNWGGAAKQCFRVVSDGKNVKQYQQPDNTHSMTMILDRAVDLATLTAPVKSAQAKERRARRRTSDAPITVAKSTPSASTPQSFDGNWSGRMATGDARNSDRCGFEDVPLRVRVADRRFEAGSGDETTGNAKFEGDVDDDGRINAWGIWPVRGRIQNANLSGRFVDGAFEGSFYIQTQTDGQVYCSAEVSLKAGDEIAVAAKTAPPESSSALRPVTKVIPVPAAAENADIELALWNTVRKSRDFNEVQRYIDTYPGGAYTGLALARVKQLIAVAAQREEMAWWNAIRKSRKVGDFEKYAAANPDGLFTDFAKARIATLKAMQSEDAALEEQRKETRLWAAIETSRKAEDFEDYLSRHPDGRFKAEARARLKVLSQFSAIAGIDFGDYHALVIGNNDYKHLPNLKTAVGDAQAVADALRNTYGFNVTLLTDARRDDLIDALDDLRETLKERDNLLIYYAGHGWLDEEAGRGYWLPVDAKENRRSKWLSNATITDTLKTLQAKHVMVIADSCYSGTLTRGSAPKLRSADYWKRIVTTRTRVVLTSGGLEPVADSSGGKHSPFAKAFIDALSANDGVMDGTQLFTKMRRPVMVAAEQTPQYSDARSAGHDGGDFLFVRKR